MFSFLLDLYLRVELLVHLAALCLTFWESAQLFSIVGYHVTFPPSVYEGAHFSTFLSTHVFLIIDILISVKQYLTGVLICISLMMPLGIFPCDYWPFVYVLSGSVYSNPLLFFNWLFVFLLLSCKDCLCILDISPLIRYSICKYFSSSVGCLCTFLMVSFESKPFLILKKSNLSILSLVAWAFSIIPKKQLPNPRSQIFTSMFEFYSISFYF